MTSAFLTSYFGILFGVATHTIFQICFRYFTVFSTYVGYCPADGMIMRHHQILVMALDAELPLGMAGSALPLFPRGIQGMGVRVVQRVRPAIQVIALVTLLAKIALMAYIAIFLSRLYTATRFRQVPVSVNKINPMRRRL